MFKLFVFVVVVASVNAAPGYLEYPSAVSHVSRFDVHHSKPVIASYAAPVAYASAPIAYAPSSLGYGHGYGHEYGHGHGYPVAQSYSNRVDIHSHATPVITSTYGHGYGGHSYGYGGHGYGYGGHGLDSGLDYYHGLH